MDTFSRVALLLLGIVAFLRFRDGSLGDWLSAKFFNSAAPPDLSKAVGRLDKPQGTIGGTGWVQPADGPVVSDYGPRTPPSGPLGPGSSNHGGVDIDGTTGDPVRAARDGRVSYAGNSGDYGLRIDIDHGMIDGHRIVTRYGHLSRLLVGVGDQVRAGEVIGRVGATGNATGDHLHYEVRVDGRAVDPTAYLPAGVG